MEAHVQALYEGRAQELVWLLEHPPLYTAGPLTQEGHILDLQRCPTYITDRGGQATYHGPGQRVAYVMLDLRRRQMDVRWYVHQLEQWLIDTLAEFNIQAERKKGRVGLWVTDGLQEAKIAAIGVKIRKWITFHGIALNISPDLSYFQGIVPCGLHHYGVTSMQALGFKGSMQEVDELLRPNFERLFSCSL